MQISVIGKAAFATTGGVDPDPGKPALLFVHGAGFDHTVWQLPSRYFANRGRSVLAVDLPGHGRSEGPPLPTIEAMADWCVALLDAAELREAAFAGHSMGALIGLEAAARHPDRIRALALLGCGYPMPVNEALLEAARRDDHQALDFMNLWGYGRQAHLGGHRAPGLWMMRTGLRTLERAAPGTLHNDLKACNDYANGEKAAAAVRCPALMVIGERDAMAPAKAARPLQSGIAALETVTIAGAGHIMMEERPDETLDALRRLL